MNVFLVILNADIKFRRYFEMIALDPPVTPLPDDVLALMKRTTELVELLYWKPVPSRGSLGEHIMADAIGNRRRNFKRAARPDPAKTMERVSSDETEKMEGVKQSSIHCERMRWFAGEDLNSRMAYGRAVMSGHGTLLLSFISMNSSLPFPRSLL